jgi:hypothetical protein
MNMKKIFALFLALALLAVAPLSLAETVKLTEDASGFDLTLDLPDGATISVENNGDVPYTFITFADETAPKLFISVAPDEEYEGDTLSSLSADELETFFTTVSADMDAPSYQMNKTAGGYDYMLVEDASQTDSAVMVLIYEGYFVQMTVWNNGYTVLSNDELTVAESLLDTLRIVEN